MHAVCVLGMYMYCESLKIRVSIFRDVPIGRAQWMKVIQNHTWYAIEIASDCAHNTLPHMCSSLQ